MKLWSIELMGRTTKTLQTSEGKHEKFRTLAEGRTNNALVAIGRIGNLSNRQLYDFEEAEVRKIVKALKEAVSEVESRFASPKGKAEARFKL
jgi:predicted amidohydrolase